MLQQLFYRLTMGFRRFMTGRSGPDQLSLSLLVASLVLSVISTFFGATLAHLVLTLVSYGLMFWAIFRMFSRNTYARYEENRKFRRFFKQIRDRQHRYFNCPKCRQSVRVPRGKGKIAITCPRCKERFIKTT